MMPAPAAYAEVAVTVDPSIQYGVWQGWGTSLAWWAKVVGGFPEPARSDYMDKAFDPVKGLGLNVVRYNIGGGENPHPDPPHPSFMAFRADIPGYQPSPGVWDWNADANQRWVLHEAIKRGANQLEAFSNSPPWWMTVSGSVTGGQGGADNLRPDAEAAFADYLATVVKHFHDHWGVTFRTLDPLNEPHAPWWTFGGGNNQQEGCHVPPVQQNAVVNATIAALSRHEITGTTATASDETSISSAADTFGHYDSTALRGLSKINTHTYGGGDRTQLSTFAHSHGKDLWMSEYGDGDASGLEMSRQILTDVNGLHPSAWVYWQVVDGGGWGLLTSHLSDETTTAYGINGKYYVLGQYSRFIRPGAVLIAGDDPNSLTAYDPQTQAVIVVTTNSGDTPARVTYDFSKFTRLGDTAAGTRTSPTEHWAKLPPAALTGKHLTVTLPAKSVTSYVIGGTAYTGRLGFSYRDFYQIINAATRLPLGATGASGKSADQQWGLVGVGNGLYKIINRVSGLTLDVSQALTTPGAAVIQYSGNGGKNQLWRPVPAPNGNFSFHNLNSGLALSADAGGAITQQSDGGAGQKWRLVRCP